MDNMKINVEGLIVSFNDILLVLSIMFPPSSTVGT